MDTINTVLNSLGINSTFFIQLAIVTVLYFVTRNLIWSKLQEVLENREAKTTKMESGADEKTRLATELENEYKSKIEGAQSEAFNLIQNKKEEVTKREAVKVKELANKLEAEANSEKAKYSQELEEKKVAIMKDADELSALLVDKIVQ
ncbi:ATP synthase B/B' CF(0) [Bacteriovorax sp. BAL6_X]|uniref:F0F1 ATP synthase subunit B family protein n=1 Tax=Bacteriovorax sp. BAL6_X TaxID=1201290 RepID=UPI000385BBC0|nr:ATP synthase B/B' CF(0) [Bacteriovorax sp. BAL6_X]EPZ50534.1 ATP synthase B/B' CF(0) [Bacteriovorax sp. BAL6_X]